MPRPSWVRYFFRLRRDFYEWLKFRKGISLDFLEISVYTDNIENVELVDWLDQPRKGAFHGPEKS